MSAVSQSSQSTTGVGATPLEHTPYTRLVILCVAFINGFVIMSILFSAEISACLFARARTYTHTHTLKR